MKNCRIFIGGRFEESDSGRFYRFSSNGGSSLTRACRCSRKDVATAVSAARSAFAGWQEMNPQKKARILYRVAEMLESRTAEFSRRAGGTAGGEAEVEAAVDRLVHYTGWADKYQQIYSTFNPAASGRYSISHPVPSGVVGVIAPGNDLLCGLVTMAAAVLTGGNTCVILAAEENPLPAVILAEILQNSDLPAGVINILSGFRNELAPHLAAHADLDAVWNSRPDLIRLIDENAAMNGGKKVLHSVDKIWPEEENENPYFIAEFQEIKTVWHQPGY